MVHLEQKKASLVFAVIFGLDIHVVSLLDTSRTEKELVILFTRLLSRCMVLLEEIDTAGRTREARGIEKEGNERVSLSGVLISSMVGLIKDLSRLWGPTWGSIEGPLFLEDLVRVVLQLVYAP